MSTITTDGLPSMPASNVDEISVNGVASDSSHANIPSKHITNGARFDFIVLGGGTAGNVVAGRLAENPHVRILVVEAGVGNPEDIEDIMTPMAAMDLRGGPHDWAYKTTMIKRDDYERVEKPNTRGKVLGGSSSLNYYTWIPGCKPTFDAWAEYGGPDWAWDTILPYLRRSALYRDDDSLYSPDFKKLGPDGPLPVSHAQLLPEMAGFREAVIAAWKSTGRSMNENMYDGEMIGLTHCLDTIYKGRRSGSFLFLRGRPNVTVLDRTQTKRLIIDAGRTCKGVTVVGPTGAELDLYAEHEVIVSEGVFETPKLLMHSGIGPASELGRFDIPVLVDSPHVGANLIDHPGVPFVLRVKDGFGMDTALLHKTPENEAAAKSYMQDRTGPMSSGLLELVGMTRIDEYLERDPQYVGARASNRGRDPFSPDGQPHFELDFVCLFGSAFQWHYPKPRQGDHLTVVVDLVRPVSPPGRVTLASADPLAQTDINLNFFSSDLDIIALREGVRFSYDLLTKGDKFRDLVVSEYPFEMPLDDDEAMKRAVLDRSQTAFHPCGTARLGRTVEEGAVDSRLRVHGIKNLRVADASIIPVIPDCRIQNSVYAVGEKCADLIKGDHIMYH